MRERRRKEARKSYLYLSLGLPRTPHSIRTAEVDFPSGIHKRGTTSVETSCDHQGDPQEDLGMDLFLICQRKMNSLSSH
jgi:hypothetical protein